MAGTGHHETAVSSKLSCGIRSLHGGGTADAAVQDDDDRPCRAVLDQIVDIPELDGTRPQMCDRGVARTGAACSEGREGRARCDELAHDRGELLAVEVSGGEVVLDLLERQRGDADRVRWRSHGRRPAGNPSLSTIR